MPGTTSINGIVSGFQTDEIIAKMMELRQVPIDNMKLKKTVLTARLTAWQDGNARVLALKLKSDTLADAATFNAKTFTSDNEDILTGAAGADAQAGTFFLKVGTLAKTHQLASQGYADIDTTRVGTGTVSVQVGSGSATTVSIDSTNNTLEGLRDAINNSGAGVQASIINDGSSTIPYRLVVTSKTGGTAGTVTVTPSLSGGTSTTFSTMQAAQDATITLGEGAGAVTVTKGTNTIDDLLTGVTLNLKEADAGKTVTISISEDTSAIKKDIADFVEQYNNLADFMNTQFDYDEETKKSATLFTDSSLQFIQSDIRTRLGQPVQGISQTIKLLSQIGITSTTDGKLSINDSDLADAIEENGLAVLKRLFATVGEAASANVSYVSSTSSTKVSGTDGYAVDITRVAGKSRVTVGAAQTEALAQDETLVLNGSLIRLTAGMTQQQVLDKINEYKIKTGVAATATDATGTSTGHYLTLTSEGYGSAQTITLESNVSNGGATPLAGTSGAGRTKITESSAAGETGTGIGIAGVDVAGTINGEAATGVGQMLTGNSSNANTAGLKLKITASTTGSYGKIHFSRGIASAASDYLDFITKPTTGAVSAAQDSLQTQIDAAEDEITALEQRMTAYQTRLLEQFSAMESALAEMQSQSTYLTSQIAQLSNGWG
jgi:flagellar hook-associated protein 2